MTPRRNPYGLTLCPNGYLPLRSHDHGDVAGSLPDTGRSSQGPGAEPPKRGPLIDEGPHHEEVLGHDARRVLGVGNGRIERLAQGHCGAERRELEDTAGLVHVLAADEVGNPPSLPRRDPNELGNGHGFHFLTLSCLSLTGSFGRGAESSLILGAPRLGAASPRSPDMPVPLVS